MKIDAPMWIDANLECMNIPVDDLVDVNIAKYHYFDNLNSQKHA